MKPNNACIFIGRLTHDPELKQTNNGNPVCSFCIAVDGANKGTTEFIEIEAWKNSAEFVAKYFKKGSMMALTGSYKTVKWQGRDGSEKKKVVIVAEQISFCGGKATNAADISAEDDIKELPDPDDLPF